MRGIFYLAILVIGVMVGVMRLQRAETRLATGDDDVDPQKHWQCPNCGETVPLSFKRCWNCTDNEQVDKNDPENESSSNIQRPKTR